MIRLQRDRLRWDFEDSIVLARILGPEAASRNQIAPLASVLHRAKRHGVQLSPRLNIRLSREEKIRQELRVIRGCEDLDDPINFNANLFKKLFPHQRVLLSYLNAGQLPAYLLADQPGVGKTAPAIMWSAERLRSRNLVVTPNSAKYQWRREIKRWSPENSRCTILDGTIREQNVQALKNGWVISHWEALVHARDGLLERDWDVVILDEAQWINNREAKRTTTAFYLSARYKLALTGHPYANSPDELWSILHFLYPELYTSYWTFFSMHVLATPRFFGGFDVEGTKDPKLLRWEIAPFTIRRTKRRVYKNLPPVTSIPRYVDLPTRYEKEYDRIKREFFAKLRTSEKDHRYLVIPSELARITRFRQYLVDPGLLGGAYPSLKYPEVREIMDELDGPPVIFTAFTEAALALRRFLKNEGVETEIIRGRMKKGESGRVQRSFHAGRLDALIVQYQAGGTALNLGRYGYVIMLDLPWNYRDFEQAIGRVDRPEEGTGKMIPTTVWKIITRNSYEERIDKRIIERKKDLFKEVFSVEQLEELFS